MSRHQQKNNLGVNDIFQKTAARVLEWHEQALSGQARPLNVTLGALSQKERVSPSTRRQKTSTNGSLLDGSTSDMNYSSPAQQELNQKLDLDSETEIESDDVVESSNKAGSVDENGENHITCEGGMMVCGVDEGGRGCVIL
mmetsp:Transcript_22479/g.46840  ORF Transcript_22479/g.46840 Transcript_22479/m.46840 type:complete len:141 (-) Transcript_22479:300-722(-)